MLIVFHAFDSSVDETRVKVGSTPVTFALLHDLFNQASHHAWLVLLLDSFCCSDLVMVVKNVVGQRALPRSFAEQATMPNDEHLIRTRAFPHRLTKLCL